MVDVLLTDPSFMTTVYVPGSPSLRLGLAAGLLVIDLRCCSRSSTCSELSLATVLPLPSVADASRLTVLPAFAVVGTL